MPQKPLARPLGLKFPFCRRRGAVKDHPCVFDKWPGQDQGASRGVPVKKEQSLIEVQAKCRTKGAFPSSKWCLFTEPKLVGMFQHGTSLESTTAEAVFAKHKAA
eukprot:1159810-Pelagomonas_calceolata.AAC.25